MNCSKTVAASSAIAMVTSAARSVYGTVFQMVTFGTQAQKARSFCRDQTGMRRSVARCGGSLECHLELSALALPMILDDLLMAMVGSESIARSCLADRKLPQTDSRNLTPSVRGPGVFEQTPTTRYTCSDIL
jgi:hypothetical protein